MRRILLSPLFAAAAGASAQAADVICYNCPPEWADWASMLKAIKADLGYDIPFDNKNSGQTPVAAHRREGESGRRHRLLRREFRDEGKDRRRGRAV
jgi:hypothetical protein